MVVSGMLKLPSRKRPHSPGLEANAFPVQEVTGESMQTSPRWPVLPSQDLHASVHSDSPLDMKPTAVPPCFQKIWEAQSK